MEIITSPTVTICKIIGKNGKILDNGTKLKVSKYCVVDKTKSGYLIYNGLYQSLVLLSEDEFNGILTYDSKKTYLYDYYYVVDADSDVEDKANKLQEYIVNNKPVQNIDRVNTVTILPTTGCNAKCFYCFENGSQKKHMTIETADKVVEYIKKHYNGKNLKVRWFGGEPLINEKVITHISQRFIDEGIVFTSNMTSNSFLISEDKIDLYKNVWKLKKLSVTIDGTEEIYNNIKQFSYSGSAYQKVVGNVDALIAGGISVSIRINLGLHNIDDVEKLVDDLIEHYKGKKYISIYLNRLYDECEGAPQGDELDIVYNKITSLTKKLLTNKLGSGRLSIRTALGVTQCMADSMKAVMILPDGELGLCEHYMDDLHIGNIEDGLTNFENIRKCCEQKEKDELCKTCFCYPTCNKLKVCSASYCTPQSIMNDKFFYKIAMRMQLRKYLSNKQKKNVNNNSLK